MFLRGTVPPLLIVVDDAFMGSWALFLSFLFKRRRQDGKFLTRFRRD